MKKSTKTRSHIPGHDERREKNALKSEEKMKEKE